ncbi:MAG: hypothetical protein ACJAS4_002097 [Bacteriovoracaceae bacterium]|jgi:hypothetical protein
MLWKRFKHFLIFIPSLILIIIISIQLTQSLSLISKNKYPKSIPIINIPYPFVFFTSTGWNTKNLVIQEATIGLNKELIQTAYQKDIFYTLLGIESFMSPKKIQDILCVFFDQKSYVILKDRTQIKCKEK